MVFSLSFSSFQSRGFDQHLSSSSSHSDWLQLLRLINNAHNSLLYMHQYTPACRVYIDTRLQGVGHTKKFFFQPAQYLKELFFLSQNHAGTEKKWPYFG